MIGFGRKMRNYSGACALVTGGASGLGLELVRLLAADGARVLATDIHESVDPSLLPNGVDYLRLDVRSDDDWAAARTWVQSHWGHLDVLVNNAGIAVGGRIEAAGMADWDRALAINLMGVVRGCHTFTPMMKERRSGQIVNTASLAGLVHAPAMATYNATKAAVVAVSEALSHELSPFGVDVSVICPSFFRTNLASSLEGADREMEESATKLIDEAPRSSAQVAAAAFAGMKAGKHVILTEPDGRVAYGAKRYARPLYELGMKSAAKRLAKGKSPQPGAMQVADRLARARAAES